MCVRVCVDRFGSSLNHKFMHFYNKTIATDKPFHSPFGPLGRSTAALMLSPAAPVRSGLVSSLLFFFSCPRDTPQHRNRINPSGHGSVAELRAFTTSATIVATRDRSWQWLPVGRPVELGDYFWSR